MQDKRGLPKRPLVTEFVKKGRGFGKATIKITILFYLRALTIPYRFSYRSRKEGDRETHAQNTESILHKLLREDV